MPSSRSAEDKFRCLCGILHVVTGTELFLLFYVILSMLSMLFGTWYGVPVNPCIFKYNVISHGALFFLIGSGSNRVQKDLCMRSTLTWLIVPICVTVLGIYAISTKKHKYLYPFLIITVVQQLVCLLMAGIILFFSMFNFETMRQIIGHSLDLHGLPSKETCFVIMAATISICILLSFMYIWQSVVIYSCLQYYEEKYEQLDEGRAVQQDLESTSY